MKGLTCSISTNSIYNYKEDFEVTIDESNINTEGRELVNKSFNETAADYDADI